MAILNLPILAGSSGDLVQVQMSGEMKRRFDILIRCILKLTKILLPMTESTSARWLGRERGSHSPLVSRLRLSRTGGFQLYHFTHIAHENNVRIYEDGL